MAIFFSWWYFTANISGMGIFFSPPAILNSGMVLVAGYSIFPSLHMQHSAASVVFCPWLHHHHHHPCAPPPRPNSFASADDISKELLAPYEAGWGKKAYLDKTGPQSGHGPKGQSPIHVKVAGGVCVLGGSAWDCQRGLFEKRAYICEAREWKGVDHKARHTSNTPRHIFTLSFPRRRRVYKEGGLSVLWHGLQNMQQKIQHVDDKVDHRGAQKEGGSHLCK